MPAFEVEFEVYCGTCGNGLCGESDTRKSRNRGENQVTVNVCPKCMKQKEEEVEDLQNQIAKLENTVAEYGFEIEKLNETIQDLQSREE